jgi:hypothetical protein
MATHIVPNMTGSARRNTDSCSVPSTTHGARRCGLSPTLPIVGWRNSDARAAATFRWLRLRGARPADTSCSTRTFISRSRPPPLDDAGPCRGRLICGNTASRHRPSHCVSSVCRLTSSRAHHASGRTRSTIPACREIGCGLAADRHGAAPTDLRGDHRVVDDLRCGRAVVCAAATSKPERDLGHEFCGEPTRGSHAGLHDLRDRGQRATCPELSHAREKW